jgi:hypothetical protein
MAKELSVQLYTYYVTRTATHIEAVITSVLNKAGDEDKPSSSSSGMTTPDTESSPNGSQNGEVATVNSQSDAATTTTAVASEDGNGKSKTKTEAPKTKPKKDMHVVGRLQSLVTSDLASITLGKDWLICVVNDTLQLALGSWFLYTVLGWAAWVGLATMILLAPIPALTGGLMNSTQVCRMLSSTSPSYLCELYRNAKWRLRTKGCHT